MTTVDFYHDAPDKLKAACQLISRLQAEGRKIMVHVKDDALAQQVDRLLWTQEPVSFVPHCAVDAPQAAHTPVLIGNADALQVTSDMHAIHDVMLNLDTETPPNFSRFEKLVEIVSKDEADRIPARKRFSFYRERGYSIDPRPVTPSLTSIK